MFFCSEVNLGQFETYANHMVKTGVNGLFGECNYCIITLLGPDARIQAFKWVSGCFNFANLVHSICVNH